MKSFLSFQSKPSDPVPLQESVEPDMLNLLIGSSEYTLELADTPDRIQEGLSGRTDIPRKSGMLFVMPEECRQDFWMKGCITNMDAIFLNSEGRIVNMHRMLAETPRNKFESAQDYENRLRLYSSEEPAKYVIEIPCGDITRLGLNLGETIDLTI
jgi:hypothetical protein